MANGNAYRARAPPPHAPARGAAVPRPADRRHVDHVARSAIHISEIAIRHPRSSAQKACRMTEMSCRETILKMNRTPAHPLHAWVHVRYKRGRRGPGGGVCCTRYYMY